MDKDPVYSITFATEKKKMDGELKIPGDSPGYLAHVDVSENYTTMWNFY